MQTDNAMRTPKFPEYKYLHGEAAWPLWLNILLLCGLLLLIPAIYYVPKNFIFFIVPYVVILIFLALWLAPREKIILSPRYIVCGKTVLYFRNIRTVNIQAAHGRLRLISGSGEELTIDREKFPTSARKEHKIAANRQAKFCKLADKILANVRRSAPDAIITGESSLRKNSHD